jgi:hypothetical protein
LTEIEKAQPSPISLWVNIAGEIFGVFICSDKKIYI